MHTDIIHRGKEFPEDCCFNMYAQRDLRLSAGKEGSL